MKVISLFLIAILILSCKKDRGGDLEEYKDIQLTESRTKNLKGNISYTLDFPDTVKLHQVYKAFFKFDSPFDRIVDPMISDSIKYRTIKFSYYQPLKLGSKILEKDIILKDSLYIPNKEFILGNIRFEEKGRYLFLVSIEDQIMYNHYNTNGKRDSIHLDRIFEEITKEVVVIE